MRTLTEIKQQLKEKRYSTAAEAKSLAYDLLSLCPPSGKGIHAYIWDVARLLQRPPFNYPSEVVQRLLEIATAKADRPIQPHEIPDAIHNSNANGQVHLKQRAYVKLPDVEELWIREVRNDVNITIEDLVDMSPFDCRDWRTQDVLLRRYSGDTLLALAWDKYLDCRSVCLNSEKFLKATIRMPPWLVPNPVQATGGKTKEGRDSARAVTNVATLQYLITEWDLPYTLEDQSKFIYTLKNLFPNSLAMVVYSGSESLHAWWDIAIPGEGESGKKIRQTARKLGACTGTLNNIAELVRTPNAINPKT